MTKDDVVAIIIGLVLSALIVWGSHMKAQAGGPPPCCTQAAKLTKGVLSALETLPPDHPAARSLEAAMNSAYGPCQRQGRSLVCEGL